MLSCKKIWGAKSKLEQWAWFIDNTYIYVLFWVDEAWESVRETRDLLTRTTTWVQAWTKPITLVELQWLTYS